MSKIFLDVTELAAWRGPLTGVPRVIYELSVRYANYDNVVFVAWSPISKGFTEVDRSTVIATKSLVNPTTLPQRHSLFKRILITNRILRRALVYAKKLTVKVLNWLGKVTVDNIVISKDDVLLIMSDWHASDTNFVPALTSLHKKGVKLTAICYDLLPLVAPQFSGHITEPLKKFATKIYPICEVLFSISNSTKNDVVDWLTKNNLPTPNVVVIRLGDDFKKSNLKNSTPTKVEKLPEGKFILCVGTIEARKNHTLLYYAYKLGHERGILLPTLVIVGRKGWRTDDVYAVITTDPDVKDKFVFIHSASDSELSWLYKNCLFTIYPSFYEGWGLPIAESIAYGAPVLASNTSSMPEVAGELIEYFTPSSPEECLAKMQKLLKPERLAESRSRIKGYNPTSWDDTFKQVKTFLESIK